jgi:hypothetical protein
MTKFLSKSANIKGYTLLLVSFSTENEQLKDFFTLLKINPSFFQLLLKFNW